MKININLQPVNNYGSGIGVFENELVMRLSKYDDLNITGNYNFIRGVKKKDLNRFPFEVKYSYIPYKILYKDIKFSLPIEYSLMFANKADINLFFTYQIPRVKYKKGITIATIHDLIPLRTEMEDKSISERYRKTIEYTLKHSNHIITVSESSKKDIIEEFNFDSNKITIIPNGVDFERFNKKINKEKIKNIKNKYNLPDRFILYMGGVRKHKNLSNLIKAYSILPKNLQNKISLVITKGNEELKNTVYKMNLDKHVVFTKFIDEEDKAGLYQLADVVTFISLYEGFGIPIIEAMAAGTPVITSNISSMPEIAGDAAILVNPNSISQISDAIKLVIEDSNVRKDLVLRGYNNSKLYSWEASSLKLNNLLRSFK